MKEFMNALAVVAFVSFAAYGVGAAANRLISASEPTPVEVRHVVVETTSGCAL